MEVGCLNSAETSFSGRLCVCVAAVLSAAAVCAQRLEAGVLLPGCCREERALKVYAAAGNNERIGLAARAAALRARLVAVGYDDLLEAVVMLVHCAADALAQAHRQPTRCARTARCNTALQLLRLYVARMRRADVRTCVRLRPMAWLPPTGRPGRPARKREVAVRHFKLCALVKPSPTAAAITPRSTTTRGALDRGPPEVWGLPSRFLLADALSAGRFGRLCGLPTSNMFPLVMGSYAAAPKPRGGVGPARS